MGQKFVDHNYFCILPDPNKIKIKLSKLGYKFRFMSVLKIEQYTKKANASPIKSGMFHSPRWTYQITTSHCEV